MVRIQRLPCVIRGVPIRDGAQAGLCVRSGDRIVSIGEGRTETVDAPESAVRSLGVRDGYTVKAYRFRGGLSGYSARDAAFFVSEGTGTLKTDGEPIAFSYGDVLDLTETDGKFVFEAGETVCLLKLEFSEGTE